MDQPAAEPVARPDWAPPAGDPLDPLEVAVDPDVWVSPRLLRVLVVVAAVVLVAAVVVALLYWIVPPTRPLNLPHPAQV